MYQLRLLAEASRELANLDKPVRSRIVDRLRWLSENLDQITPQPLTGDLAGLYKFRVGDFRILYEIQRQENTILIHAIGHRREIYR
jgi:mRNA interferase RelE/StbE